MRRCTPLRCDGEAAFLAHNLRMPLNLNEARRPRVYVAGPDVFRPDAAEHLRKLAAACEALGMEALVPPDGADPEGRVISGEARARRIYEANTQMLRSADGVIANLQCFRGQEPDSGTVFEVGFAIALQLPVVAYGVPEASYAERVQSALDCRRGEDGVLRENADATVVEDFGLRLNLMLGCSVMFESSAEDALKRLAARFASAK